jgi:hypothetical protein
MSTVTVNTGVQNDNADVLYNVISTHPPFIEPHGVFCKKFVAGTDFQSGDDIVINFEGSEKLLFWIATSNVGAIKEGAEDVMSGVILGRELTFSNVTTDLHVLVYYAT